MCGIIGAIAERNVVPILMEGIRLLEYRGYDSAGISVIANQQFKRLRATGKIKNLQAKLDKEPLTGHIGISHTRWATHGKPTEANAHPHIADNNIAIVHNGIIENHKMLRTKLKDQGICFHSETDSEIIAHLIHQKLATGIDFLDAVTQTTKELEGAYALVVMHRDDPNTLIVAKHGSPLVMGLGIEEHFVSSDVLSLVPVTNRFIYLEDGDIATLTRLELNIIDIDGKPVARNIHEIKPEGLLQNKDGYKHFMFKEINEQPTALANTLNCAIQNGAFNFETLFPSSANSLLQQVKRIQIVACGTSYHAGLVAKYWFEEFIKLPVDVDIASELRYRQNLVIDNTLFVVISQSGETADTLCALKEAKTQNYLATLAICNVKTSNMVRYADFSLITKAGPEIGVASTKAFTTQLMSLYQLMCYLGQLQQSIDKTTYKILTTSSLQCASLAQALLSLTEPMQTLANYFVEKKHALFLGRGTLYPIALEGALKLKEISYINAQAYPAGELKHGPIALIDQEMPVISVVANNHLLAKVKANLQEVHARGGELIVITEKAIAQHFDFAEHVIEIEASIPESIAPILYTIPLQLLAYFVAVAKGTDVDQPRNLAKSVTVE